MKTIKHKEAFPRLAVSVFLALISSVLLSTETAAAENRDLKGVYFSESDSLIIAIDYLRLYIISAQGKTSGDTLTACKYININDSFIKITSDDDSPMKDVRVMRSDYTITDSVYISFDITKIEIPLTIFYSFPNIESDFKIYRMGTDNSISIPNKKYREIKNYRLIITPFDISDICESSPYGYDYGIIFVENSFDKETDKLSNSDDGMAYRNVKICIPNLSKETFTRLYIPGDFVRIEGDTLLWRGRRFVKKENISNP